VTASSGVATFAGCKITGAAGPYTLTASASALTSGTSSSFTITNSLHISSLVTGATTGTTQWGGGATVTVKDVNGTVVSGVVVTGTWNPTSAATASGCTTNTSGQCAITAGSAAFPSTQLTESWTVSGLAAPSYTYDSASNTASTITISRGCAAAAVCATDVGDTFNNTSNASSTSVTLSGTNGAAPTNATVLILVARDGTQNSDAIPSVTGTAISGATSVNAVGTMSSHPNSFSRAWVYRATGTGTASGTVTVTFNNADNIGTLVEVLVASGNQTSNPIAQSLTNTGSSNSATASLTSPSSSNAEVVLVAQGDAGTAMGTPSGWTRNFWNTLTGPTGANFGAFYGPSASASQSISLGANAPWGTIALEIARGT